MNLFYFLGFWWELLEEERKVMVLSLCNLHANKMLLEAVQMLYTVNHQLYGDREWCEEAPKKGYKPTHAKHPITVWAGQMGGNWFALLDYADLLCGEFVRRFRGGNRSFQHKCARHVAWLRANHHPSLDESREQHCEPPPCVGDVYREVDVEPLRPYLQHPLEQRQQTETVLRYRLYYVLDKLHRQGMMNKKGGGYWLMGPTHYQRGERKGQVKGWKRDRMFIPPDWLIHAYNSVNTLDKLVPESD